MSEHVIVWVDTARIGQHRFDALVKRGVDFDAARRTISLIWLLSPEERQGKEEDRMRLFRRARDTKTSVIRREAVSAVVEAAPMMRRAPLPPPSSPVAALIVDDQELAPKSSSSMRAAPISAGQAASGFALKPSPSSSESLPMFGVPATLPSYEHLEESDVFVKPEPAPSAPVKSLREVTLFVHGWHQVEPGLLSWTFPSLRAALDAVQRMKNAIGWCIVSGTGWTDLDAARANGAILVEQLS